jgi:hypothetical protein
MSGEWTETDRLAQLNVKYKACEKRNQSRPLERLLEF